MCVRCVLVGVWAVVLGVKAGAASVRQAKGQHNPTVTLNGRRGSALTPSAYSHSLTHSLTTSVRSLTHSLTHLVRPTHSQSVSQPLRPGPLTRITATVTVTVRVTVTVSE